MIQNTPQMEQLAAKRRLLKETMRSLAAPTEAAVPMPTEATAVHSKTSIMSSSQKKFSQKQPVMEVIVSQDEHGNEITKESLMMPTLEEETDDNLGNILQAREDTMKTALSSIAVLERKLIEANETEIG